MTRIRFISADGATELVVTAAPGTSLLELAQANDQPLEGTCEGAMACSTCHVLVSGADAGRLPPPSDEEEDMLDFAVGASRASRLACQIVLTPDITALDVRMPPGAVDMSRR